MPAQGPFGSMSPAPRLLALLLVGFALGVTLSGCGDGDEIEDVNGLWEAHKSAFKAKDIDKIMLNFDANSIVTVWDSGVNDKGNAPAQYKGADAIKNLYTSFLAELTGDLIDHTEDIEDSSASQSILGSPAPFGGVFYVWSMPASGFELVTDTFWIGSNLKIRRQNTVVMKAGNTREAVKV